MIYGYIRVSTDKQTIDNQRFEIERFCSTKNLKIEQWIEETISGSKSPEERLLGSLLAGVKKDDLIICSEISRLGRSLFMIMAILNHLMKNGAQIWTIKDNFRLTNDLQSKVMACAFGLTADIERELISQRTKEALARKQQEGVVLGRPRGKKSTHLKLSGHEEEIKKFLKENMSKCAIARKFGVNRMTVDSFIKKLKA